MEEELVSCASKLLNPFLDPIVKEIHHTVQYRERIKGLKVEVLNLKKGRDKVESSVKEGEEKFGFLERKDNVKGWLEEVDEFLEVQNSILEEADKGCFIGFFRNLVRFNKVSKEAETAKMTGEALVQKKDEFKGLLQRRPLDMTRSKEVLGNYTDTENNFSVEALSHQEARNLFDSIVGDLTLPDLAVEIVKRCAGLPLTVGLSKPEATFAVKERSGSGSRSRSRSFFRNPKQLLSGGERITSSISGWHQHTIRIFSSFLPKETPDIVFEQMLANRYRNNRRAKGIDDSEVFVL
ncbi:hypothetical protein Pint_11578 [Pistacia integerrima]|uniref:Uncharacterized protein n=1 Tax=Pistacia integerrima TaxID=434235 RepID=A0ACC0XEE9_9ROSI|nr:hypothetical protein Pint_11578 [Pistacia integerrima]